jgi:hypothetical protein
MERPPNRWHNARVSLSSLLGTGDAEHGKQEDNLAMVESIFKSSSLWNANDKIVNSP